MNIEKCIITKTKKNKGQAYIDHEKAKLTVHAVDLKWLLGVIHNFLLHNHGQIEINLTF